MKTKLFYFMKNAMLVTLYIFSSQLCAQEFNSSCEIPSILLCEYAEDVKSLAIEVMNQSGTADTASIKIIPEYEDIIWKGLSAIFNVNTNDITDLTDIFDRACVHTNNLYSPKSIRFELDIDNFIWTQNWIENNVLENNELVNFLNNFDYRVNFDLPNGGIIKFDEVLNLNSIINELTTIDGFSDVRFETLSDGNNIIVEKNADTLTFTFKVAWGDCLLNCNFERTYLFNVNLSTCVVHYLGANGISLDGPYAPLLPNCNIKSRSCEPLEGLFTPIAIQKNNRRGLPMNSNGFEFKTNFQPSRKSIPNEEPRYSYFWNFGDGNFSITQKELGNTFHNFNSTGNYNVTVQRTKIKPPPKAISEINLRTDMVAVNQINAQAKLNQPQITIDKNVQLTKVRSAVPGSSFTLVSSFKNSCEENVETSKATITFNKNQLLHSCVDVYYGDKESRRYEEGDSIKIEIDVCNITQNETRNFFANFQINPDIKIGEVIEVCLTYENCANKDNNICEEYKVGKSHDPSFKRIENPNSIALGAEPLEVFIHVENEGEARTDSIAIIDSIIPSLKIDSIIWDNKTDCREVDGEDSILESKESVRFDFNPIYLRGQKEPGYLTEFDIDSTKEEFSFKMKFDEVILNPTYFCNKADVYFDDNPPEIIYDCFYSFGTNMDTLPTKRQVKKMPVNGGNVNKLVWPNIFPNDYCLNVNEQSVTIVPDLSDLPTNNVNYLWWPNQETTDKITVSPSESSLYRMFVSWLENDTLNFATDLVIVEVKKCTIDSTIIEENIIGKNCFNGNKTKIEINLIDVDKSNYTIYWDDLNQDIYGDSVFIRDTLYSKTYFYTLTDLSNNCEYRNTIFIEEATPLTFEYQTTKQPPSELHSIEMLVYGGVPDYEIIWTNNNGDVIQINTPIPTGKYSIKINDKNNCTLDTMVEITNAHAGSFNCEE